MANISGHNKPSEYKDNDEKKDVKYGLNYARYIWSQHQTNSGFISKQSSYEENEKYRQGIQDNTNVMNYLLKGKDKSYGHLNFDAINIIPKYTKVAKKNLNLHLFNPKCKAIDATSVEDRKKQRNRLVDAMINRDFAAKMTQLTGVDQMPKGFIPSNDQDIDVFMETESILPQEAAIECALDAVREANNFQDVKDRLADDVMAYGKVVIKDDYDPHLGVVTKRISPPNYVTSFDGSGMNDNRNAFYDGHIEMVSLIDLHGTYGIDENKCLEWATGYSAREQEYITKIENKKKWDDINQAMVKVLFFEFRTTLTENYRHKTRRSGRKTVERKDGFNFNKNNVKTIKRTKEVWFEGVWIIDSPILLNYDIRENMVKDSLKKVRSSYSSYDTNEMPLVRKLIPFSDKMNMALIKIDQMVAAARPKGVAINLTALLDVPNADGDGNMSYLQLVRMFDETGNQMYRLDEFSAGQSIPITELENGLGNDVEKYINIYNHNLQQINNITGINPQMAGMGAPDRVSTESNQIALQSSIRSIEFIKDAVLSAEKRLSENIILRIQDIDKHDVPFKKYVQALGIHSMEALNMLDSLHPYTFSLFIEMMPDEEEERILREDISIALQQGDITLADKMDVDQVRNLKYKSILLRRRIEENTAKKQQQAMQIEQAKQQSKMAELQMANSKINTEYDRKSQLAEQQFGYDYQLELLRVQGQQAQSQAKQMEDYGKEARRYDHENQKEAFKVSNQNTRQDKQLKAVAEGKASEDTVKNMKKTALKK